VGVRRVDWKHDLLPDEEQREPMLRRELTRVSVVGLRAVSLICIGGTSLMLVFTSILKALGYLSEVWIETDLAIIAVGLAATPFWRKPSLQKHARAAGCLVGLFIGWIFIVTAGVSSQPGMDQAVPYNLLLVMLVAMAALPLRPLQTMSLAGSLLLSYVVALAVYPEKLFVANVTPLYLASLSVAALISVGLTAVVYRQRASAFLARQQLLRAQASLALAESSAAQGRLAAAMSHDLNSPLATLRSNLETLARAGKKFEAGELPSHRLVELIQELEATAQRACLRLVEVVGRMQRFTNLDRAEEASVDLNRLLEDTVDILRAELQKTTAVSLELQPIPFVRCRPQQMSAVFANLLRNSRDALGEGGVIRLRSMLRARDIVVEIEDNGRGIPRENLDSIFEPSFKVSGSRVVTGNWGLFNSRSIIHALGGEIALQSVEGNHGDDRTPAGGR